MLTRFFIVLGIIIVLALIGAAVFYYIGNDGDGIH